jgi:hypothetical protein
MDAAVIKGQVDGEKAAPPAAEQAWPLPDGVVFLPAGDPHLT